ncbi:phage tail protein [Bartonella sp. HY761]|uniref:phage tail protein n=1 Tax=Bartonella sp. HY761 TaxID=2979330 RepID=UPI002207AF11|nr:phage tail protein [Bartonella sp. HY761]UXN07502.1 phage tail protein [Bartonella sp. HY761]
MADNQRYFTLLTDKGKFKIAKATADKGEVKFSHFAIGDGGGQEVNPLPSQTGLVHEVWRTQLDSVEIDPKNPAAVIINAIIPHNVGGWWMREFGLFDVDGDMLAVVKPAPYYKATSAEGQLEDVFYEFQLVLGEQAQVVVLVDPTILWATRDYVETRRISTTQFMNTPWLPVKSISLTTPPNSNNQGDTYVVPSNANSAWLGQTGQLAEWNGKAWSFWQTQDGHGIGLPDGRVFTKVGGQYIEKIAIDSQSGKWNYAEAGGTANALTATLEPKPLALTTGMVIQLKIAITNIGATTLNLNGFGAKPVLNFELQLLKAGELPAGLIAILIYDGANFICTNSNAIKNWVDNQIISRVPKLMRLGAITVPATGITFAASRVTFDIAFPTRCTGITITPNNVVNPEGWAGIPYAKVVSRSQFDVVIDTNGTKNVTTPVVCSYIAIGE